MRSLIIIVLLFTSVGIKAQVDIMSSPLNNSYIGFKLKKTTETHKFFLEIRNISTNYKEIYSVLKDEFDYGVRLVYNTSDQRSNGVYIIFHNSLLYNTILSKLRKCIQERYGRLFKKELEGISFIYHMLDVAYGRVA